MGFRIVKLWVDIGKSEVPDYISSVYLIPGDNDYLRIKNTHTHTHTHTHIYIYIYIYTLNQAKVLSS